MFVPLVTALALSSYVLAAPAPQVGAQARSSTTSSRSTSTRPVSSATSRPVSSAPVPPSSTIDSSLPVPTLPYASDDLNESFLDKFQVENPEPIRGSRGTSLLGPQNVPLDRQNSDLLAGPTTDNGAV